MQKSTTKEIEEVNVLVRSARAQMQKLIQSGKRVHVIWDFDGVLADSRSDDIFKLTGSDIKAYFEYEERLLFESPGKGSWLLPIAHNCGSLPHFPQERFTQDIVTARSSTLALRAYNFCTSWALPVRWMLCLGHQPKQESYRIILESLKNDPDYRIFCVDDNAKHVEAFQDVARELGMEDRAFGIVSPAIRAYTEDELREYYARVMGAVGDSPIRVRDPSDDFKGFLVLPKGLEQYRKIMGSVENEQHSRGYDEELRQIFVRVNGEVGTGRFKTEEELEQAMREFVVGLHCP
ncbi:hypothetical protein A2673_00490 [Candidatus Kaiserbacteria bacterium RIFCSPHIGHO2_01_FULL_50_13]|uniref:Uncharacterized protein n=1 Tax=Candidatus Kaiserbacteria bacterium RIFCSPLOWO2_01_FULL_50_24 TaxID=1798507 RepID=A0A1F6EMS1_9BACT|nr:MAG: hypothetical protein A2673_00490 [Candidatus Kaiserbacteria bacterium RIFCSPHIGHO2_01_FULL_50_13]OGG74915.1 MAG: hypothetical protein A3A34_03800 [Candidatus Kaiserbacteria bacterium RIFCSPLOWO2_01_FULL_50_24]OGG82255.1 MAG: hypothetical protein A3H74_03615 [Candidatus Kaiserbacteria bacterium RIFCSPLOWO2_02_FULL_51_13]